jgi:hypothetical protein
VPLLRGASKERLRSPVGERSTFNRATLRDRPSIFVFAQMSLSYLYCSSTERRVAKAPTRRVGSELAGGRSAAQTSGPESPLFGHPGGMPERFHPCQGGSGISDHVPVVSLRSTTDYSPASLRLAGRRSPVRGEMFVATMPPKIIPSPVGATCPRAQIRWTTIKSPLTQSLFLR